MAIPAKREKSPLLSGSTAHKRVSWVHPCQLSLLQKQCIEAAVM